jgi:Tfp pilus assembly protein PilZ
VISCFRRSQRHPRVVGGVGIDLHPGARPKVEYLLRLHGSGQGPAVDPTNRRRHDRLTLDFPVTWQRTWSEPALARLRDIGYGGAFVKDAQLLPVGDSVLLGISVPGADVPTVVTARVAWVSLDTIPGFGVKWRARDTGGLRLIREMVSRIAMPPTAE